jgi:hypothetical protein
MRGLAGKRIKRVRMLTPDEVRSQDWGRRDEVLAIELEDGTLIFPAMDYEGNGPGALFAKDDRGNFYVATEPGKRKRKP